MEHCDDVWCEASLKFHFKGEGIGENNYRFPTENAVASRNHLGPVGVVKWYKDLPYATCGDKEIECDVGLAFMIDRYSGKSVSTVEIGELVDTVMNTEEAKKYFAMLTENLFAIRLQDGVSYADETERLMDGSYFLSKMVRDACNERDLRFEQGKMADLAMGEDKPELDLSDINKKFEERKANKGKNQGR